METHFSWNEFLVGGMAQIPLVVLTLTWLLIVKLAAGWLMHDGQFCIAQTSVSLNYNSQNSRFGDCRMLSLTTGVGCQTLKCKFHDCVFGEDRLLLRTNWTSGQIRINKPLPYRTVCCRIRSRTNPSSSPVLFNNLHHCMPVCGRMDPEAGKNSANF